MDHRGDWSTQAEGGSAIAMRVLRWLALYVPRPVLGAVLWCVALVFVSQPARATTRAARNYLTRINGQIPDRWRLHRHALNFAHVATDRARFLQFGLAAFDVEIHNPDPVHRALEAGTGAILLGAHFGSFEAMRAFDRMLPGLDVRYLMFDAHARTSTHLLGQLNREVAERVIPLGNGPAAMLAVSEALQDGRFIAFLGDRQPETALGEGIEVSFLSDSVTLPTSPYLTAMAAKVPLILCFAPRIGQGRYRIEFSMLYDGAPVPRNQRDAKCRELAEDYVRHLEELCRRYPDNWFNFFDIWGDGVHRVDPDRGNRDRLSR